jgi:hypothetical protein
MDVKEGEGEMTAKVKAAAASSEALTWSHFLRGALVSHVEAACAAVSTPSQPPPLHGYPYGSFPTRPQPPAQRAAPGTPDHD